MKYSQIIEDISDCNIACSKVIGKQKKEINNLHTQLETLKNDNIRYSGEFKVSYYCACKQCCGKTDGITASGVKAEEGITVAADTSMFPFGTKIYIVGIGERTVQDKGGAIKGNKIDVYVKSHDRIPKVGVHNASVWVVMD